LLACPHPLDDGGYRLNFYLCWNCLYSLLAAYIHICVYIHVAAMINEDLVIIIVSFSVDSVGASCLFNEMEGFVWIQMLMDT